MAFELLMSTQKEAVKILKNSYNKARLSHAYIFEGEAGTKKFDAALFFASLLLCENDDKPCGECKNCRRIQHLTHPNIHVIRPTKKSVVKDDIKELQIEFSKTALEEGAKIYIIEQADSMNAYAQNALLKFLEEPHSDIYGILLAEDAGLLLPTIKSRSQHISFHPLQTEAIKDYLVEQGYDEGVSNHVAQLSSGLQAAESLIAKEHILDVIDAVKDIFLAFHDKESTLLAFDRYAKPFMSDPEQLEDLIDGLIHYQKDLIYGKMNHHAKILFTDQIDIIESIVTEKSQSDLIEELEAMITLKSRLKNYINTGLAFDNLMLLLERRTHREE